MEKSFVVIVDSMADFEVGYSDPNLVVVKTPVMIGGEDYTNATPDEFFAKQKEIFQYNNQLRRSGQCPIAIKTAAPNIENIREEMVKILRSGKDAIYVASASTLTSAFNSGKIAVQMIEDDDEEFENKAIVIDGLSMSALTAVLVRIALRDCNTTDEFVRFIFDRRNDTEHLFMVTEWDAFRDSGRISPATLAIATISGFKPLMRFEFNDEGVRKAYAEKKSRHIRKLLKHAVDLMEDTIDNRFCMILHGENEEGAALLHQMVHEQVPDIITLYHERKTRMGPATGVHLGYSVVGLAFLRKKGIYPNAELHRKMQIPEEGIYGYTL